jgi:hypothetical protein
MPSELPVPTVEELRQAFRTGILSERDPNADTRTGSVYDLFGGMGAMVFRRLALRDRNIFRATYFDFAEGDALTELTFERFGNTAGAATRGTGRAIFTRPTASGGPGTFWAGTRITLLPGSVGASRTYLVTEDTAVGADLGAIVPVHAEFAGPDVAVDTSDLGLGRVRVEDLLWDSSWKVTQLSCSEGAAREKDEGCRARVKEDLAKKRLGYAATIVLACKRAGAVNVTLFASDYLATNPTTGVELVGEVDADGYGDIGLNRVYVADASYTTPTALLNACRVAVDGAAMTGMAVQIFGMVPTPVTVKATVRLWSEPGRFASEDKIKGAVSAVLNHFETRQNPFYFRRAQIRGDILRTVKDVQAIDLTTSYPGPDATKVTTEPTLPEVLAAAPIRRFLATPESVIVKVTGPLA